MTEDMVKEEIKRMIYNSGMTSASYSFINELPRCNNGVGLSKWMAKEIEEVEKCIDSIEENVKSVCRKGCAECCKQCIVVLSSELPVIQTQIDNMDNILKTELKEKTNKVCAMLEENGITNERLNSFGSKGVERKMQEDYFDLSIPCIFLDDQNACMIYSVRPTLCWSYREYYDAEKCKISCFSDTSIKFDDWDKLVLTRLVKVRKPHRKMILLPFAIKEMMNW